MKKIYLIIIILFIAVLAGLGVWWQFGMAKPIAKPITSFEQCAAAGNPVMESYPRQCRAKDGWTFVEQIDGRVCIQVIQRARNLATGEERDFPTPCAVPSGWQPVSPENNPGILPYDSGVSGVVSLGPTCPVLREPPDPSCADKPYKTTVQVIRTGSPSSAPFATVETDEQGRYKIMLPPGEYALQPVGGKTLPRCETKAVTIEPGVVKELNLSCDSGIR